MLFRLILDDKLAQITEEGVKFSSPVDGKEMMVGRVIYIFPIGIDRSIEMVLYNS